MDDGVDSFSGNFLKKHQKLGDLKQQKNILSTVLEARSAKSMGQGLPWQYSG